MVQRKYCLHSHQLLTDNDGTDNADFHIINYMKKLC